MDSKSTILIVDDNESGRKTLDNLLYGLNLNLEFAENGFQALEKAEEILPDLILLDIMMPGIDGFEVCRRLRATPKLADIPVVMVTMLDDYESRLEGIKAGADDFITKPFNSNELEARVMTITKLNRYRRLVAERAKLDWVINQVDNGFYLLDGEGAITYANHQGKVYLNLPDAQEALPQFNFFERAGELYNLEPSEFWKDWKSYANQTESPLFMIMPETPQAKKTWLRASIFTFENLDNTETVVRLHDSSKEVENAYSIRTFSGLVSHKLRTPLLNIMLSFEVFEKSIPKETKMDFDIRESFREDIFRLKEEIEKVLNFTQIPSIAKDGATNFEVSKFCDLVREITNSFPITSVECEVDAGAEDYELAISESAFHYIIFELTENAYKFHPDNSPHMEFTLEKISNENSVCLSVTDNGVKLSPEQMMNAWNPYYQGDKHFTGEVQGMGLGLPGIAYIVWDVGGKCRITNRRDGKPGVTTELIIPIIA